MSPTGSDKRVSRREMLREGIQMATFLGVGGLVGFLAGKKASGDVLVWQIDPYKCIACGNCATHCVLDPSAVKCVNSFPMCGYCDLCTGYFPPEPLALNTGAENQLCPTGALIRKLVEEPYYEYTIDENLCIACGKCVVGCAAFGNGSLYLQVRHDRCLNCHQCSIAIACPSQAFVRLPASQPYLLKHLYKPSTKL